MIRNKRERLKGKISISDPYGSLIKEEKIKPCTETSVGKAAIIKVDNASWRFSIKKKEPSPFLVFKKPYFVWCCEAGHVSVRKTQTYGNIDYTNNIITLSCKPNKADEVTHKVKVVLLR